jgi:hypothetical protein
MIPIRHQIARLLIGAMLTIVSAGAVTHAQDDWEREEQDAATRQEDLQKLRVEQQRQRLQMSYKAQFDRWFSSQFRHRVGALNQLEMRLAARIRELEAEYHLTGTQVKKLELAGRGDIKRYMDRFNRIAGIMENPLSTIDDLRAARVEMSQLDTRSNPSLFGEGSLLCKTLASTLDEDQSAARERALRERNAFRHRSTVNSALSTGHREKKL